MSSSQGENLSDIKPNPVVDQNLLIPNLQCTLLYLILSGLVEIKTQPLSYSKLVGIWAISSSWRKTFLICKLDLVMYQDSAHSHQFSRGIQAMSSSERKTFLILNLTLKTSVQNLRQNQGSSLSHS